MGKTSDDHVNNDSKLSGDDSDMYIGIQRIGLRKECLKSRPKEKVQEGD